MKIISYKFLEEKGGIYYVELTVKRFLMKKRKEIVFSKNADAETWRWLHDGSWANEFNFEMACAKETKKAIEAQQLFKNLG